MISTSPLTGMTKCLQFVHRTLVFVPGNSIPLAGTWFADIWSGFSGQKTSVWYRWRTWYRDGPNRFAIEYARKQPGIIVGVWHAPTATPSNDADRSGVRRTEVWPI